MRQNMSSFGSRDGSRIYINNIEPKSTKISLQDPISFCLNDFSVWGCRWWQQKPTGSFSSSFFPFQSKGTKTDVIPSSSLPPADGGPGPCRRRLKCRLISTWTLNDSSSAVDISGRLIRLFNAPLPPPSRVIPLGSTLRGGEGGQR